MNMLSTWPAADGPDDDAPSLAWLDGWLRADVDVEVPPGFRGRVVARIEAEQQRLVPWRQALGVIGMVLSGVLLVAWSALLVAGQWHAAIDAAPLAGAVLPAARALAIGLLALGGASGPVVGRAVAYAVAAVAVAALWFGVTVAPRAVAHRQPARRRP